MAPPPERFHLRTLGLTGLWSDERLAGESLLLPLSKPLALLTYLDLAPGRTMLRDEAVDLLWSNADEERGRQSLRQSIWLLRKRLGAAAVATDDLRLTLTLPLATDRAAFLRALQDGEWTRAIEQYHGPFFEGFAAPGAGTFELWADLQREHLAARHRVALEMAAQEQLASGRWRDARDAAKRLRDADPRRESSWRLLLEALLAGGDRPGAVAEASELERAWGNIGRPLEPGTQRLVAMARETALASVAHPGELVAELVGRSREFAVVLGAWTDALASRGQHLRIAGAAGMGKSRLLADLRTRLTGAGATVVMVRANPGEHHLSYALAAELARVLGALPGAKGVSEADAAILVGFVPALASSFRVQPEISRGTEVLRRRSSAMSELLAAVSDEQPLVLLVDDVHWADADSRTILSALMHRVDGRRILAVTTERPLDAAPLLVPGTRTLELCPLAAEECEALMGSLGTLPAEQWTSGLGESLARSTGGSPLLLLETLRLAIDRGWLALGEEWQLCDAAGWQGALDAGSALGRRIGALSEEDLELLGCLAAWGVPVPEARLRVAVGQDPSSSLDSLQRSGFAVASALGWSVAHDEVAGAALRVIGREQERLFHARIGEVLCHDPSLPTEDFPAAATHLILAGADAPLGPLFRRWLVRAHAGGVPGSDRDLARLLLGPLATEPRVRGLLRSRSWARRLRPALAAATGLAILAAAGATLEGRTGPARIALTSSPREYNPTMVPDPVVEVLDRQGRRLVGFNDTLVLSSASPWIRLEGGTVAVAQDGIARFSAVRTVALPAPIEGPTRYRVEGRGVPALEWHQPSESSDLRSGLWLVRGMVNGQHVDATEREVRIAVGDSVRLELELRYASAWSAASVMLGGTATWGRREDAAFTIKPLVTPVDSGYQHVAVTLRGPQRAGRYAVILFFDAEDDVLSIASGTNWLMRRPVWHDGNDVADWTADQLAEATRIGTVSTLRTYPPPVVTRSVHVPATVLYIIAAPGTAPRDG